MLRVDVQPQRTLNFTGPAPLDTCRVPQENVFLNKNFVQSQHNTMFPSGCPPGVPIQASANCPPGMPTGTPWVHNGTSGYTLESNGYSSGPQGWLSGPSTYPSLPHGYSVKYPGHLSGMHGYSQNSRIPKGDLTVGVASGNPGYSSRSHEFSSRSAEMVCEKNVKPPQLGINNSKLWKTPPEQNSCMQSATLGQMEYFQSHKKMANYPVNAQDQLQPQMEPPPRPAYYLQKNLVQSARPPHTQNWSDPQGTYPPYTQPPVLQGPYYHPHFQQKGSPCSRVCSVSPQIASDSSSHFQQHSVKPSYQPAFQQQSTKQQQQQQPPQQPNPSAFHQPVAATAQLTYPTTQQQQPPQQPHPSAFHQLAAATAQLTYPSPQIQQNSHGYPAYMTQYQQPPIDKSSDPFRYQQPHFKSQLQPCQTKECPEKSISQPPLETLKAVLPSYDPDTVSIGRLHADYIFILKFWQEIEKNPQVTTEQGRKQLYESLHQKQKDILATVKDNVVILPQSTRPDGQSTKRQKSPERNTVQSEKLCKVKVPQNKASEVQHIQNNSHHAESGIIQDLESSLRNTEQQIGQTQYLSEQHTLHSDSVVQPSEGVQHQDGLTDKQDSRKGQCTIRKYEKSLTQSCQQMTNEQVDRNKFGVSQPRITGENKQHKDTQSARNIKREKENALFKKVLLLRKDRHRGKFARMLGSDSPPPVVKRPRYSSSCMHDTSRSSETTLNMLESSLDSFVNRRTVIAQNHDSVSVMEGKDVTYSNNISYSNLSVPSNSDDIIYSGCIKPIIDSRNNSVSNCLESRQNENYSSSFDKVNSYSTDKSINEHTNINVKYTSPEIVAEKDKTSINSTSCNLTPPPTPPTSSLSPMTSKVSLIPVITIRNRVSPPNEQDLPEELEDSKPVTFTNSFLELPPASEEQTIHPEATTVASVHPKISAAAPQASPKFPTPAVGLPKFTCTPKFRIICQNNERKLSKPINASSHTGTSTVSMKDANSAKEVEETSPTFNIVHHDNASYILKPLNATLPAKATSIKNTNSVKRIEETAHHNHISDLPDSGNATLYPQITSVKNVNSAKRAAAARLPHPETPTHAKVCQPVPATHHIQGSAPTLESLLSRIPMTTTAATTNTTTTTTSKENKSKKRIQRGSSKYQFNVNLCMQARFSIYIPIHLQFPCIMCGVNAAGEEALYHLFFGRVECVDCGYSIESCEQFKSLEPLGIITPQETCGENHKLQWSSNPVDFLLYHMTKIVAMQDRSSTANESSSSITSIVDEMDKFLQVFSVLKDHSPWSEAICKCRKYVQNMKSTSDLTPRVKNKRRQSNDSNSDHVGDFSCSSKEGSPVTATECTKTSDLNEEVSKESTSQIHEKSKESETVEQVHPAEQDSGLHISTASESLSSDAVTQKAHANDAENQEKYAADGVPEKQTANKVLKKHAVTAENSISDSSNSVKYNTVSSKLGGDAESEEPSNTALGSTSDCTGGSSSEDNQLSSEGNVRKNPASPNQDLHGDSRYHNSQKSFADSEEFDATENILQRREHCMEDGAVSPELESGFGDLLLSQAYTDEMLEGIMQYVSVADEEVKDSTSGESIWGNSPCSQQNVDNSTPSDTSESFSTPSGATDMSSSSPETLSEALLSCPSVDSMLSVLHPKTDSEKSSNPDSLSPPSELTKPVPDTPEVSAEPFSSSPYSESLRRESLLKTGYEETSIEESFRAIAESSDMTSESNEESSSDARPSSPSNKNVRQVSLHKIDCMKFSLSKFKGKRYRPMPKCKRRLLLQPKSDNLLSGNTPERVMPPLVRLPKQSVVDAQQRKKKYIMYTSPSQTCPEECPLCYLPICPSKCSVNIKTFMITYKCNSCGLFLYINQELDKIPGHKKPGPKSKTMKNMR